MIIKAIKLATQLKSQPSRKRRLEGLMLKEAALGGYLFGPVPNGLKRSFYVQDKNTVIWQEGDITTKYLLEPDRIIKHQSGQSPQRLSSEEANRLVNALRWYTYLLKKTLYQVA